MRSLYLCSGSLSELCTANIKCTINYFHSPSCTIFTVDVPSPQFQGQFLRMSLSVFIVDPLQDLAGDHRKQETQTRVV